jgi:hypothetical protein
MPFCAPNALSLPDVKTAKNPAAVALGKLGGLNGGKAHKRTAKPISKDSRSSEMEK